MNAPSTKPESKDLKNSVVAGILLIVIGAGLLLFQFFDGSALFVLFLGACFLVSGMITRKGGLIIPGGILGGVGLGILAIENNPFGALNEPTAGGVFLVAFSLGWFAIPLLTRLFTGSTEWWALIPGGILALIGGLILAGETGLQILEVLGTYWPVVLVIIGAGILIQYFRRKAA